MSKALGSLAIISLIFIYLIVVAGSVVRATGSGMGCPDWPKCFGRLIPPTSVDQVEWHADHDFTSGLMIIHNDELWTAKQDFQSGTEFNESNWEHYDLHDYTIYNPVHTWIEFCNRLMAPISGVPIMLLWGLTLLYGFRNKRWTMFMLSTGVVLLVGFEAWLGKILVEGNLVPGHISMHMAGTFGIIALLLVLIFDTKGKPSIPQAPSFFKKGIILMLGLLAVQMFLGTQVREQVDSAMRDDLVLRENIISILDAKFYIHRSFSILMVAVAGWLLWKNQQSIKSKALLGSGVFVILAIVAGVVLAYGDFPASFQPIHLWVSVGIFSCLVYALIQVTRHPKHAS